MADNTKADLAKIKQLLKTWQQNKVLDTEERLDEKSNKREFYVSGSDAPQPLTSERTEEHD